MSGETEQNVSGWTTDTLHTLVETYVQQAATDRDKIQATVEAAVIAERDYAKGQFDVIRERLSGMDRATSLLSETVNRVPTDVDKQVGHLKSLHDERFISIDTQFKERDTRQEREARDNKVAVDAAFAAQKEAATKQDESNAKAINKSEAATTETINKLSELFKTTTDGLADKIDDLKTRLNQVVTDASTRMSAIELSVSNQIANKVGGTETKADNRAWIMMAASIGFLIVAIIGLVIGLTVKP